MTGTKRGGTWGRFGAAASVAALLAASGCGRSEAPGEAVRKTATSLEALAVGGSNPPPSVRYPTDTYGSAINGLKPATTSTLSGEVSAANLMMSRSQAGLAGLQALEASQIERRTLNKIGEILAAHDQWVSQQSIAAALEQFNPAPELAKLDDDIKKRVEETTAARAAKQSLDDSLAALEASAKAELDKAKVQRDAEAKIRQEAVSATATKRAELITTANEKKRAADGFDKQAALLRAQAAARAPEGVELQSHIDRLSAQSKLLADAKAEIQGFARLNSTKAAESKAEAAEVANKIKAAADALVKLRASPSDPADAATKAYAQAARAAIEAAKGGEVEPETKSQAKLAQASCVHAKGDVLAAKARGLASYGDMLKTLSTGTPPLPDAAAFAAQAQEVQKQQEQARKEAQDAYTEAKGLYESIGGRADLKERLAKLGESLQQLIDGSVPPPAWLATSTTAPAPAEGGGDAAAAAADARTAGVRQAIEEMIAATKANQVDKVMALFHAKTPEEQKSLDLIGRLGAGFVALDAACKEKFGSSLTDALKKNPATAQFAGQAASLGGGAGMGMAELENLNVADLEITLVNDTTAKAMVRGGAGVPMTLVKAGGAWKFELPPQLAAMGPMLQMVEPLGQAMTDLAGDVKAGKFATADEVAGALMARMMAPPGGGRKPGAGKPKGG